MSTRTKILSLASDHHASEIARLVGVSRQRVTQILQQEGVQAASAWRDNEPLVRERTKTLKRMARDRYTVVQAAEALGLSPATLHKWMRRHGLADIPFRSSHIRWKRVDEIERLAKQGLSKTEIARRIDMTQAGVNTCAARHLRHVEFKDGRRKANRRVAGA